MRGGRGEEDEDEVGMRMRRRERKKRRRKLGTKGHNSPNELLNICQEEYWKVYMFESLYVEIKI